MAVAGSTHQLRPLFYLFSLLLEHFERDVSLTRVNSAPTFSIALLMEGVLGVMVCRLMGAGRAQVVMCGCSLLAGVGFAVMSIIQTQWQLYAVWVVCGVTMSGALYQPTFSVLIRRYPQDFRRAIITLTFLGGLASTVFIPLGATLIGAFGWRGAVIVAGALHVLICLPIHAYWLRDEPPAQPHHEGSGAKKRVAFTHQFPFWGVNAFLCAVL